LTCALAATRSDLGAENASFAQDAMPFCTKNDRFTKTGSRQT
jgi:hypothetical protein